MKQDQLLVEVKDLKTYFFLNEGLVRALDGVDFNIWRGQTLGVVGESGCGKSVTARSILRIVPKPGKIVGGEITFLPEFHRRGRQHDHRGCQTDRAGADRLDDAQHPRR